MWPSAGKALGHGCYTNPSGRLCCIKPLMSEVPFPWTDSSHGFCDRYAKRAVAVHDADAVLYLRDLSVKVLRHEALP